MRVCPGDDDIACFTSGAFVEIRRMVRVVEADHPIETVVDISHEKKIMYGISVPIEFVFLDDVCHVPGEPATDGRIDRVDSVRLYLHTRIGVYGDIQQVRRDRDEHPCECVNAAFAVALDQIDRIGLGVHDPSVASQYEASASASVLSVE